MRRHFFCEKVPLLVILLIIFFGVTLFPLAIALLHGFTAAAFPFFAADYWDYLLQSLASLLLLWLHKRWFAPHYEGSFPLSVSRAEALRLSVPFLTYLAFAYVSTVANIGFHFHLTVEIIAISLMAGIYEETIFRALPLSIGMRYMNGPRRVWWLLVLTSLLFGIAHAGNMLAGASPELTAVQIICCFFFGIYAGGLTLITGSILPIMVWHAVNDVVGLSIDPSISDGILRGTLNWSNYLDLGFNLFLGLCGLWMVIKHKDRIFAVWDRKWQAGEAEPPARE